MARNESLYDRVHDAFSTVDVLQDKMSDLIPLITDPKVFDKLKGAVSDLKWLWQQLKGLDNDLAKAKNKRTKIPFNRTDLGLAESKLFESVLGGGGMTKDEIMDFFSDAHNETLRSIVEDDMLSGDHGDLKIGMLDDSELLEWVGEMGEEKGWTLDDCEEIKGTY